MLQKGILLAAVLLLVTVVFRQIGWYLDLPVMQVDYRQECLRIIVVEEGREVVKPCKSLPKGKTYLTEYVGR